MFCRSLDPSLKTLSNVFKVGSVLTLTSIISGSGEFSRREHARVDDACATIIKVLWRKFQLDLPWCGWSIDTWQKYSEPSEGILWCNYKHDHWASSLQKRIIVNDIVRPPYSSAQKEGSFDSEAGWMPIFPGGCLRALFLPLDGRSTVISHWAWMGAKYC